MYVRELMTINPVCCTPDTPLEEAAAMMDAHHCGALPVVTSPITKRVIGIITDRDITCRAVAYGKEPSRTLVRECMSMEVVTITADATVEAACRTMSEYQVRRLPVVDSLGRCEGMLAQADVARKAGPDTVAVLLRGVSRRPLPASSPLQV